MPPVLTSHRLTFRPLVPEDGAHFARLLGDDHDAVRQMAQMPDPCTEPAARRWIQTRLGPGGHVFAILRRNDGEFLGVIGFGGSPSLPEMGYWIGKPYRGQGYATEAIERIIVYAASLGVAQIHADTFPDNPASARVLTKAGFVTTGLVERSFPARGGRRELLRHIRTLRPAT
jgi:RimJ/RimL family protein N-acetyltransferase